MICIFFVKLQFSVLLVEAEFHAFDDSFSMYTARHLVVNHL